MNSSAGKAGRLGHVVAFGREHPVIVLLAVATLTSLPCLWNLLQDLDDDPDMGYVADAISAYQGREMLRLFTETAPWGDGSYRPFVFLSWKLDSVLFGRWAPGWALHNCVLAVGAVSCMGLLVWWTARRPEAAITATALAGLRQATLLRVPPRWLSAFGVILPAGIALAAWERRRPDGERYARWLWLGLVAVSVAVTVLHTEIKRKPWVSRFVGGRTAALGSLLHFLVALAAWQYLGGGSTSWLAMRGSG